MTHGIIDSLKPLATPIGELHTMDGNPRRGNVAALQRSLKTFGQRKPIVALEDGTVIAGNHTLLAAKKSRWSHIAVVRVKDDPETASAYALADNRISDLAVYDDAALEDLLGSIDDAALLAATAWDPGDLDAGEGGSVRDEVNDFTDDPTSDDYYTPAWVFEALGLTFDLDVASPPAHPEWIPAKRYYTEADDGLASPWEGLVWMNPPYSKPGPWVEKFLDHGNGVALLPFTNSQWGRSVWQSGCPMAVASEPIRFVGGGIVWATFFVAAGKKAIAALPNVGTVRTRT